MDEPTSGRFEGRSHLLPIRVYYEDTDFSGLVYHANYLRFFERGEHSVGLGVDTGSDTGAFRLYERAGMTRLYAVDTWKITVSADQ